MHTAYSRECSLCLALPERTSKVHTVHVMCAATTSSAYILMCFGGTAYAQVLCALASLCT
jgi:hypothetical protein